MIQVIRASKELKGKQVLIDLNHEFAGGSCTLLRGHNGCGKTMFLRLLCGLIQPSSGQIVYDQENTFGVVIENTSFFLHESAEYNLRYLASIRKKIGPTEVEVWLKKVDLYDVRKKKVRTFSLGMKQRLAICQAFMESPDVILLDEPFNALDAKSVDIVCELIQEAIQSKKTIVIAAHGETPKNLQYQGILQMDAGMIVSVEA